MQRKGYNESFDKDKLTDKKDVEELSRAEKIADGFKTRIKKLPMNIVEFVIGLGLLFFCRSYIQNNPAEKSSLFNGIESIVENIQIKFLERTTGKGSEVLQKRQLIETFDTIISTAESIEGCIDDGELERIKRARENLQALTVEEFVSKSNSYSTVANIFYTRIQEECLLNN